jgi:hypothetical protein
VPAPEPSPGILVRIWREERVDAAREAVAEEGLAGAWGRRGVVGPGEVGWEDGPWLEVTVATGGVVKWVVGGG